jgi:hypothetical protein
VREKSHGVRYENVSSGRAHAMLVMASSGTCGDC